VYDKCPLGAGASYGVNWKIDPSFTAKKLGFSKPLVNALSAINNRGIEDGVIISQLAVFLTVLSRIMEDLIIWSLPEINYIAISEEFTTGSSIMPQKVNPDIAEKIKSKSAKLIANFSHVLIALKGTPSGYNRDSAESKIAIMASLEESLNTISIANDLLAKVTPNVESMKNAVIFSLPTKLTDELVKECNIPFRTAHKIVGKTVGLAKSDVSKISSTVVKLVIKELTGRQLNVTQKLIDDVFNVNNALKQYQYEGSPGPEFVSKVNKKLKIKMQMLSKWSQKNNQVFNQAQNKLFQEVNQFINS
jgi:argininosuccinate lyase